MRSVRQGAAALLLCLAPFALSPAVAFAQTADDVFVPSFWDPHHRIEKPDLGALRSLRFLTEDDYPPFHFALPDGSLTGFDVDLARAICEELKITCTIQERRFETLIDALENDLGDALIASVRIDGRTKSRLDFTAPYYTTPARFVALKTRPLKGATPEALKGKTIGVGKASAHEAFLKRFFPDSQIKSFETQQELREALKNQEIDALFGDGISLSLWLNGTDAMDCCALQGGPFTDRNYFGDGVGIAVKKGNTQLRQALDYALARLASRGTYTELYLKYFPIGFY
jgi:polar amino acid transport system substrate-binding protein